MYVKFCVCLYADERQLADGLLKYSCWSLGDVSLWCYIKCINTYSHLMTRRSLCHRSRLNLWQTGDNNHSSSDHHRMVTA